MWSCHGLLVYPCKDFVLGRQFALADVEPGEVRAVHQLIRTRARDDKQCGKLLGVQHVRIIAVENMLF